MNIFINLKRRAESFDASNEESLGSKAAVAAVPDR